MGTEVRSLLAKTLSVVFGYSQMLYSDFTLNRVAREFNLTIVQRSNLFTDIPELVPSDFLQQTLDENIALALASNTEKARSELIITPILVELRKLLNYPRPPVRVSPSDVALN